MADYSGCLQNARIIDPKAVLCANWVCEQNPTQSQITKFCHCQPPYPPQNPCPYGGNTPVVVYPTPTSTCFCCCSCFAYDTKVVIDEQNTVKDIQHFAIGDQVMAGGPNLQFEPATVEFSSGVKPHPDYGKTVVTVYYGEAIRGGVLVVTPDHVFLTRGGKTRRAVRLVPGTDVLIGPGGEEIPIVGIEVGGWNKGLHHIATTNEPATSLDGHLLIADGIVSGDWALQSSNLDDEPFAATNTASDDPHIGGAEYEDAYPDIARHRFLALAPGVEPEALGERRPEGFRPYGLDAFEVPEEAMAFVTKDQADAIFKHTKQRPVTNTAGQEAVFYLFKVFGAFYPDIHFHLAWDKIPPNAHSYRRDGLSVVVLNGGLVRTPGITFDGLAVVLAHEVGHLVGGQPLDPHGYSCQGQADYAAMAAVMRGAFWAGDYGRRAAGGLAEVTEFFGHIGPNGGAGNGAVIDKCNNISIACRLSALMAGLQWAPLPECAGGPEVRYLVPLGAVVQPMGETAEVIVTFNLPVATPSVDGSDFTFDPALDVASAIVDSTGKVITVTAALVQGTQYTLTIADIVSDDGKELQGGQSVLNVKLPTAEAVGAEY